jgi:hypothetical protein
VILVWKTCKSEFSFALFLIPVCISSRSLQQENIDLPYATVSKVVEWRKHDGGLVYNIEEKGEKLGSYMRGNWRSGECDIG